MLRVSIRYIMVDLKILRGSMRHDNAVSEMMRAIISYENI